MELQAQPIDGSLSAQRESRTSGEGNLMARRRFQKGYVFLQGAQWKGRYREDMIVGIETKRVRREVILGTKRDLPTKALAMRRMEVLLARINGLDYRPGRVATFGEFLERWKADILTKQQPSSARAVKSHLKCYIVPQLDKLRLEQFGVESPSFRFFQIHSFTKSMLTCSTGVSFQSASR
jgi:integrase-like protein